MSHPSLTEQRRGVLAVYREWETWVEGEAYLSFHDPSFRCEFWGRSHNAIGGRIFGAVSQ